MEFLRIVLLSFITITKVESNFFTNPPNDRLAKFEAQCLHETNIDAKLYEQTKKDEWVLEDEDIMSWSLCFLKKFGLVNETGVFKMDVALARTKPEDRFYTEEAIDRCLGSTTTPAIDRAWDFFKCYYLKSIDQPYLSKIFS